MNFFETILLGFLQGLTEFLPVSSSGHLAIAQHLMKFEQPGLLFDTLLHCATLVAVLAFFRHRVGLMIRAFFGLFFKRYRVDYVENKRFLWGVIIASIPTAIIGLFLEQYAMQYFQVTAFIGYGLIFTSLMLFISDKFNGRSNITSGNALIIGVMQGIAVMPGISRSGSTIALSVMLGVKREEAAEFSFLMSVPAIFGAALLQARHIGEVPSADIAPYVAGMVAALISGMFAIKFMMAIVAHAKLKYFALYCLTAGILTVVFL